MGLSCGETTAVTFCSYIFNANLSCFLLHFLLLLFSGRWPRKSICVFCRQGLRRNRHSAEVVCCAAARTAAMPQPWRMTWERAADHFPSLFRSTLAGVLQLTQHCSETRYWGGRQGVQAAWSDLSTCIADCGKYPCLTHNQRINQPEAKASVSWSIESM